MYALSCKYETITPNERNWQFMLEKMMHAVSLWKDIKINILETGCV
jgi:hypothetical protein